MATRTEALAVAGKVELAHEPAFNLGGLTVEPALRRIVRGHDEQSLEPRVMQVLVALVRAKGNVVTRSELTDWCWGGRIVGDDAINRALSQIRGIAKGFGRGSFKIETTARVGFRLVTGNAIAQNPVPNSHAPYPKGASSIKIARRKAIAGIVASSVGALGAVAWWRVDYRPTAEAAEFYRKGVEARSVGLIESAEQATVYFRQAVRSDPEFAGGWGALARQLAGQLGADADLGLDRRLAEVRLAAGRALALDPDEVDAKGALAVVQPYFRRWQPYEAGLLEVESDHPGQRQVTIELGTFYSNVGRWADAIAKFRETRRDQPSMPGPIGSLVLAYWAAGRLEEAEAQSFAALQRWPRFHGAWFARMILLTYGGRPEQAVAFASNPDYHPSGSNAERVIELRLATARALVSRDAGHLAQVRNGLLTGVENEILNAPQAMRFFSALGEHAIMFELLEAYFYRRGRFAAGGSNPIHPHSRIGTDFLFHPTSRPLWGDPRFAALTRDIGLDRYWTSTGFVPAHRRG
jgi:DNA-binding winged helix-turn-helix (wHTH) protein